jgi:glutaredoxin
MSYKVYTRSGCPYCTKIKDVMRAKKLSFQEFKLDVHFDRSQFYEQFGPGSTFPQVLLDSKRLGGCTETVKYLRENNLI